MSTDIFDKRSKVASFYINSHKSTMYVIICYRKDIGNTFPKLEEKGEKIATVIFTQKMKSNLIKDTTKEERIALIKAWVPDDDGLQDCDMDLWDIYADYINGKREIAEINAQMTGTFYTEDDLEAKKDRHLSGSEVIHEVHTKEHTRIYI